jgi:hypothetical protein
MTLPLADTPLGLVARAGTFVQFVALFPNPKTARFSVVSIESKDRLGVIQWCRWRCYAFFPEPDTLFEEKCLGDITAFLATLRAERKAAR